MIDRGQRSNKLNEVKPVENINKNSQDFLEISVVQKEFLHSHNLQDHAYDRILSDKRKIAPHRDIARIS